MLPPVWQGYEDWPRCETCGVSWPGRQVVNGKCVDAERCKRYIHTLRFGGPWWDGKPKEADDGAKRG